MKKPLTLTFLLLICLKLTAQTTCDSSFRDYSHHILKNLDKSQIPTGALYEYIVPFADLEGYTGARDTDTSGHLHFLQAYQELYEAIKALFCQFLL